MSERTRRQFLEVAGTAAAALDSGEAAGQLYMSMELLEGEDLRYLIERRVPIPVADRVRILIQICEGVEYAHSKGVVHRDIKPANILVTTSARVKILDFGLARVITRAAITRRGVILGTPDYMSPEQAMGKPVDRRSDVFSAGSVFYEFLTLRVTEQGLSMQLKHFNPDMSGWEEKKDFVEFLYVGREDNRHYFNGLTFIRDGEDALTIYLALRGKDGSVREQPFVMRRQK